MTKSFLLATMPLLASVACSKDPPTTTSGGTTTSTITTPVVSASSTTTTASAPPVVSATTTASTEPGASAKKDAGGANAANANTKPVSTHIAGNNFALDVASPGCKEGAECAMTIKLSATGDWHLNKEYPYKFLASSAPNVTFLGKGEATTFSRSSGDFVEQGEKAGTMTVRFKPEKAGEANVSGTYKLSVCSADQCQIEQAKVSLAIPVL